MADYKRLEVRVDVIDFLLLEDLARKEHRTTSGMVRHILQDYLSASRNEWKYDSTESQDLPVSRH